MCLEMKKFLKLLLVSQAMSCSSCLQSKNVFLNQEVPQISADINPHHAYHVHHPKLVLQMKNSPVMG